MWLYFPPIRAWTSATYEEGKNAWSDDHILRDLNQIKKTVEFYKSSEDPESSTVRDKTGLKPKDAGEAHGKPRG